MITDSGGFQVFSLAHGDVADEIKGRRGGAGGERRRCSRSPSAGCASAPTSTARSGSSGPRSRWRCRRRSAPTSRSSSTSARPSTPTATTPPARPSAPTAGSTAASPGTTSTGPRRQAVFGIVQGGVHEDLRRESAEAVAAAGVDGIAIGGTLGRDKAEMHGVLEMTAPHAAGRGAQAPARDRRARRPARRHRAAASTSSTARCRPASPATAWRSRRCPRRAFASTSRKAALATDEGPLVEGCPCPTCAAPHPRLPALPRPRRGADRGAAAHPAQPRPSSSGWSPARGRRSRRARFDALPRARSSAARPPWSAASAGRAREAAESGTADIVRGAEGIVDVSELRRDVLAQRQWMQCRALPTACSR